MMAPDTEADLAECLSAAVAPLRITGGGTRPIGRPVAGEVLSTAGISGVVDYEPGALTLVVRAGTPLAEVERVLVGEGQHLAFEPMDHRRLMGTSGTPTIGGVVAGNVSGPRRVSSVGACRDSLLGVRFVDGAGRVLKNGGRVMKNVTGYDLVKLMAGSWGTLGVLSEVSLKVLPVPETEATLTLRGLDAASAIEAMAAALGSPYEVTGAAHGLIAVGAEPLTRLRIEGFEASVRYRADRLSNTLARFGTVEVEADKEVSGAIWRTIRDVAPFEDRAFVARLSIKPTAFGDLSDAVHGGLSDGPLREGVEVMLDWGGGLVWVAAGAEALSAGAPAGPDLALAGARRLHETLQAWCARQGGHATLIRGPEGLSATVPSFQPEAPAVAALAEGLRLRFDPKGILNPGLMT